MKFTEVIKTIDGTLHFKLETTPKDRDELSSFALDVLLEEEVIILPRDADKDIDVSLLLKEYNVESEPSKSSLTIQ